jgi:hypothetical protein
MPRRRRVVRKRDGVVTLLVLLVLAMILLLLVMDGRVAGLDVPGSVNIPVVEVPDLGLPDLNLPRVELPNLQIPITGLPRVEIPSVRIPVTVEPGDLIPDIAIGGTPQPGGGSRLAAQSRTSGCQVQGSLPDPGCTPGAVTEATREQVCAPGFAAADDSAAQREAVFAMYGIAQAESGQYRLDHLVPLALGGSNDSANLWPQPTGAQPGQAEKDALEGVLRERVCAGDLALSEAQRQIALNWLSHYYALP